jgi:hypothetical protein
VTSCQLVFFEIIKTGSNEVKGIFRLILLPFMAIIKKIRGFEPKFGLKLLSGG